MSTRGAVVGLLAVILMLGAFLWLVPEWQLGDIPPDLEKDLPKLVNEYRRTLAQAIAGFVLLLGLYFTWRTLHVTREGQITERFTRAIDQLAATTGDNAEKNVEARMGGIYALERIARESERDHWAIMDILTAYVRQHARPNGDGDSSRKEHLVEIRGIRTARILHQALPKEQEEDLRQESDPEGKSSKHASKEYSTDTTPPLDSDIQAVMNVIRRRKYYYGKWRRDEWLRNWLQGEWLRGKWSHNEWLRKWLRKRLLNRLRTSYLVRPIDLSNTDLHGAQLWEAHLEGTTLENVNFVDASFEDAHLQGAYLKRANLSEADLKGVDLQGANLQGANLKGADLQRANLQEADLQGANLLGANLLYARGLIDKQIEGTIGNDKTELPEGLSSPDLWRKSIEEQRRNVLERIDRDGSMPFVRWGAVGAVIAGVAWAVSDIFALLVLGAPEGPIDSTSFYLIGSAHAIAEAGTLAALVGLYVLQARSLGRLGVVGFAVAFIGTALVLVSTLWTIIFLDRFGETVTRLLFSLGLLGWLVGFVLFGVATFRARVLPSWSGLLLVIYPFAYTLLLVAHPLLIKVGKVGLPFDGTLVLVGLLWLALGYVLWIRKK